jgi:hypothetical protein
MGIPVSLLLIAAGAILTWAVNKEPSGVDLNVVGVILMVVGIVGLFLTLLFWETWWGRRPYARTTYREAAPSRGWYSYGYRPRRRTTYVEDEVAPPPGPPPGAPPPP